MWFWYALGFAILSSFGIIIAKKVMGTVDQYTYLLINGLFTAPTLLIIALIFFGIPTFDTTFWTVTLIGTSISVFAAILAYKAIRESEISLISPISAFNPAFTAIISFFTLKEVISLKNIFGIVIIVSGTYLLQLSKSQKGFFKPIKTLFTHKGVRLSLFAQFLWAVTPSFEKTAILHTFPQNPSFAAFIGQIIAIFIYIPLVWKLSKNPIKSFKLNFKWFLIAGLISGLAISFAFIAYNLANLGVVTAVFKLSMVFTVFFGWFFFKEKNIKDKLLGTFVMLAGVTLLVI